jgi:hypothetical protein
MNIDRLFEKIQNKFDSDDLNGEFQLQGNCIIWTHNLEENSEEIAPPCDDEEDNYSFDSISPEELLLDAYNEDFELLEEFFEDIEETDNWTFSDPETGEYTISFRIF